MNPLDISDAQLTNFGFCPICGKAFEKNGIGPKNGGEFTRFLHSLPSSHIFYTAANIHDIFYHYNLNDKDRKKADDIFLSRMLEESEKQGGKLAWWYKLQAYRNYWSVRAFGSKYVGKCNLYP
jgi:hypothetical protein